jgi:hypothetical protein
MVWLPDETALVPGTEVAPTMIIVRDERGTGTGWDVVLTATDETGAWDPVLQGNTPSTITRLLPVAQPRQGGDAVSAGGTTSDLRASTAVLRADEGGGAGVFTQVLTIIWPDTGEGPGLVSIQLPFAP